VARRAAQGAQSRVNERRAYRDAVRRVEEGRQVPLDQAHFRNDFEAPAPFLPAAAGGPPSRAQQRFVLALMAAIVVIAFGFAIWQVGKIGQNTNLGYITHPDDNRVATVSPTTNAGGGTTRVWPIITAKGYDPSGDGVEHDAEGARVYDGDPKTAWTTEGYSSPLSSQKPGVGLIVDLGKSRQVGQVSIQLPDPATFDVYLSSSGSHEGARKLGSSTGRSGEVKIVPAKKYTGQFVIVWLTEVPQDQSGQYRAAISEIEVSS
ncbi:hypothetical protein, partial [Kribbia dieselivorans]|uniref:hypothetical protein n=1 Tax=Kribbia dieselivorans TaxID=331526 RepID=UPI001C3F344C